jgi:hypothetical protein
MRAASAFLTPATPPAKAEIASAAVAHVAPPLRIDADPAPSAL